MSKCEFWTIIASIYLVGSASKERKPTLFVLGFIFFLIALFS